MLEKLHFQVLSTYIDSLVAITLGIFITLKPIKIIREAFKHLLDGAPTKEYVQKITNIIHDLAKTNHITVANIKITQAGRFLFSEIHIELAADTSLAKLDSFKQELKVQYQQNLQNLIPEFILTV